MHYAFMQQPTASIHSRIIAGWSKKVVSDIVCVVDSNTVNAKYMIKSQNFILSFYYTRYHYVNGVLVPLDNEEDNPDNPLMNVEIFMDGLLQTIITLGELCSIDQLRQDLINEVEIDTPPSFYFKVNGVRVSMHFFLTFTFLTVNKRRLNFH